MNDWDWKFFRFSLAKPLVALVFLVTAGGLSFHYIEGWPLVTSFWMAVITISTVGFGEPEPMSDAGRVFTIFYIISGVAVATYTLGSLSRMLIEGEFQQFLGRRRAMTKIRNMRDHYVVCGYGRIGQMVIKEFLRRPTPFVVVEKNEEKARKMPPEIPVVVGDATEEQILLNAGIENARGLVTVLHSDAANLFVTLSAREINPKLFIIARYEEERTKPKLLRAGADKVVSPYIIGGTRMAMAVSRPAVIDFIDLATQSETLGLQMEEVVVLADSPLNGVTLVDSGIRSKLDIIVVAVQKASGHMVFNPGAGQVLEEGDRMVAIGEREQLNQFEALVSGKS